MSRKFVCDNKNETFKKWLVKHKELEKSSDEELAFVKKRIQLLEVQRTELWDELFESLKTDGLIPKDYNRDDFAMQFTPDHLQLFIQNIGPRENGGVPDFLKHLFE